MSDPGVVRRSVDARVISYAIAVLKESESMPPEIRQTLAGCATAALQAASGIVAMAISCKVASESPAVHAHFEDSKQRERFTTLMASIGSTIDEEWRGELRELLELVVVLAAETASEADEQRLRTWAQGLYLDTRSLAVGAGAESVPADIEIDSKPDVKRTRVRQPKSSKESYEAERFESLVTKAIAMGVTRTRPLLVGGRVVVVGDSARGEKQLLKLRGSVSEAQSLCDRANEELRSMRVGEAYPS